MKRLLIALGLWAAVAAAAAPPSAEISNGVLKAKVWLPDPEKGYYQGTRFDWSGSLASVEYKGHNYFGVWFPKYDPKIHDAITGPVEEFLSDGKGLGYDEAKVGENFVKIGVGAIKKPDEPRFTQFKTYDVADYGKWSVKTGKDYVEFTHVLGDTNGYAYVYKKTVRLARGKPEMTLEHSLKNTGKKTIATSVYEHNFYMIDALPTGPDVVIKFAFEPKPTRDLRGMAEIRGKEFVYLKELQDRQSVSSFLEGFGPTAKDYDIREENRKAGAGVRQTSDHPMSKLNFWSIRTTACPEAYIDLKVDPGKETTYRINYEFYTLNQ